MDWRNTWRTHVTKDGKQSYRKIPHGHERPQDALFYQICRNYIPGVTFRREEVVEGIWREVLIRERNIP